MTDVSEIDLVPLEHDPPRVFSCTREEQNRFLHDRAIADQREGINRTYLALLDGVEVGYITLAMDAIPLYPFERPSDQTPYVRLPAVKLCQLAVDEDWEGRGIGKQLVALAMGIALRLGEQVGCRYLTVDAADSDLVNWYKGQEFAVNKLEKKERAQRASTGKGAAVQPTSMRFDLFHLLADLQERFPSDFRR